MPNHCYSTLSLNSDNTKEQKEFIKLLNKRIKDEEMRPLCNMILPMPDALVGTTSPTPKARFNLNEAQLEMIELFEDKPDHYGEFTIDGTTYCKSPDWRQESDGETKYVEVRFPTCEEAEKLNKEEEGKQHPTKYLSLKQRDALIEEYGASNWYDWSNIHHGTKWGDYDTELDDDIITFTSAWGPISMEIIHEVAKIFPDLNFSFEEEQGWGGEVSFADGEMVDLIEWDVPYHEEIDDEHQEYIDLKDEYKEIFDNLEEQVWFSDGNQGSPYDPIAYGFYYDYVAEGEGYDTLEALLDAFAEEAKKFKLLKKEFELKKYEILDQVRNYDGESHNLYCFIGDALRKDEHFKEFTRYEFVKELENTLKEDGFEGNIKSDFPF